MRARRAIISICLAAPVVALRLSPVRRARDQATYLEASCEMVRTMHGAAVSIARVDSGCGRLAKAIYCKQSYVHVSIYAPPHTRPPASTARFRRHRGPGVDIIFRTVVSVVLRTSRRRRAVGSWKVGEETRRRTYLLKVRPSPLVPSQPLSQPSLVSAVDTVPTPCPFTPR